MSRMPSINTLSEVFENAKEARRILVISRSALEYLPAAKARIDECYGRLSDDDIRMHTLNAIEAGLHGVESVKLGDEYAEYLNVGEMYAATLIFWRGNYRVQSLGDFIEIMERRGLRSN